MADGVARLRVMAVGRRRAQNAAQAVIGAYDMEVGAQRDPRGWRRAAASRTDRALIPSINSQLLGYRCFR